MKHKIWLMHIWSIKGCGYDEQLIKIFIDNQDYFVVSEPIQQGDKFVYNVKIKAHKFREIN